MLNIILLFHLLVTYNNFCIGSAEHLNTVRVLVFIILYSLSKHKMI